MAYILNIETATKNCSVALAKDGILILCKEIADAGYSHAEKLHVFIDQIIHETNITYQDLSAIAVSKGPGSYTGLRIGISAAKGLCYALQIPLIAVDTLESLAHQVNRKENNISSGTIIPMIDARRMEVYSAVFNSSFEKLHDTQAEIISEISYNNLTGKVYFVGDCAEKGKTVLNKENFIFLDDIQFPSAIEMCPMSFESYKKSDTVDVAYFEPFYLKDFFLTKKH